MKTTDTRTGDKIGGSCYSCLMTDIDQRNRLRAEAGLPLLNTQAEERRVKSRPSEQAAFEQEWQASQAEFADQWVSNPARWVGDQDGSLSHRSANCQARDGDCVARGAMNGLDGLLRSRGYKLVDDAWLENGRRTYLHDEDSTRDFIVALANTLRVYGWSVHPDVLRAFVHPATGEMIEVESGGAETSGHFLHHLKTTTE